jgi:hypothetical protein
MFSQPVNYQINCFTLNNAANRVMVAGKSEWELLTIGENQFISNDILSKKMINFRIMDICWSKEGEIRFTLNLNIIRW